MATTGERVRDPGWNPITAALRQMECEKTPAPEPRENRALCARRRPPEPTQRTPREAERVRAREAARDEARFAIDLSR